ncbi:ABC transporter ATP-binding protein [Atopobacter sp. AH10]|uniref:ABC transporter ATP-binding protein n=1 Tax=Atopobacter sp. AH10 TaxID=2315861 RepID=UPI000EF21A7C|nr:ABC transporter ATP-binding protein [Atopobacter sp. AH10]RLK63510.1 ABC transporter ATP-binding protein [Atopobacter sp. AH10]
MITFKDVEIRYGDFVAVPKLNFTVQEGEFFTLLGPSGCGKTTTLRALAGFLKPSHGRVEVDGVDITNVPIDERQIGMVFQSYALFPTMTAFDNIAFGLKVEKRPAAYIKERVHELAKMVDLNEEQLEKNVSNMSGGQQQRVAIARALAKKPKILVMDEPLSNLDAKLRKSLRKDIKNFQQKFGITTVYVTHDQEEALMLSDRIAVFNKGKIEQIGHSDEIYNQSATEFVCNFIGEANQLTVKDLERLKLDIPEQDNYDSFYIRPEKVSFSRECSDERQLEGKIVHKEFYGMYGYYSIDIQGTQLLSFQRESKAGHHQIGEVVFVDVKSDNVLKYQSKK